MLQPAYHKGISRSQVYHVFLHYPHMMPLVKSSGFQVDAKENEFGCEPLQWAARRGHLQLIRLLLNHGAKTSYQDKENRTAANWVPG